MAGISKISGSTRWSGGAANGSVVVDGDADPERGFVDLGDAVRKIWIDLGVRIRFPESDLLQATREAKPENVPYFAVGTVEYVSDADPAPEGKILYIKPTVRGDEWAADVIAYSRANPSFPHQSTADQWFDEPQLEAYRALGYLIMKEILDVVRERNAGPANLDELFRRLKWIDPKTLRRKSAAPDTQQWTRFVGRSG